MLWAREALGVYLPEGQVVPEGYCTLSLLPRCVALLAGDTGH